MPQTQTDTGVKIRFAEGFSPGEQKRIMRLIDLENLAKQSRTPIRATAASIQARDISEEERQIGVAERQIGSPLARDPASGVPAEVNEPGLRFDLARSDNVDEQINKIKDKFPLAEVVKLDEPAMGNAVAIKLPGEDKFRLLDSNKLATFSDVADVAGFFLNAESAATILSVLATKNFSLLTRMFTTGGSAGIGAAADQTIEAARGFQEDPIEDIFTFNIAPATLAGAGGEVLASPARAGVNIATRRGAFRLTDEERLAIREFEDSGVRGPSVGAVAPAFRGAEGQAVATSKNAQDFARGQTKDALQMFKRIREKISSTEDISDSEIERLVGIVTDNYKRLILGTVDGDISRETAGRAIIEGRKEFKRIWKDHVSRKYNRAFDAGEGASFDISETQKLADEIIQGVKGKGRDGKTVQLRDLSKELQSVIKKISDLDSSITDFEGKSGFEQIKELRTQLFDLKNATIDGKETVNNRFAGQLWDSLTRAMDSPVGGSENFNLLIRAANNSNKRMERMLEVADIVRISRETEPASLVDLVRPGKSFTTRLLKRVLPEKEFETFRRGFITKLISKPKQLIQTLDDFADDPQTLNVMLTKEEQAPLREFGRSVGRLEENIEAIGRSKLGISSRTKELINSGDVDTLLELIRASGGKNSVNGKKLRRGVISFILDRSEQLSKGVRGVNPKAATNVIEKLDKDGVLDAVMLPEEKAALKNKQLMLSLFTESPDAGASIQAAELGAQAAQIVNPEQLITNTGGVVKRFIGALGAFTRNFFVGTILMNPTARRIILGAGSRPVDLTTIRLLTSLTAEAATNADAQNRKQDGQ